MKWSFLMMYTAIAASAGGAAHAGDSLLRIGCEGADIGAEVHVNGKFKGECPLDIKVKPGTVKLRLHKPLNQARERVFELELRIGEDVVKKVEAQLDERYTAAGQQQEDAKAERARIEQNLFEKLSAAAEAGDVNAQMRMAERYETGRGVGKDTNRAAYWYRKAGNAGNELGTFLGHHISTSSPAEDVEAVKRMFRLPKGEPRMLNVRSHAKVITLVGEDAFFALPEGGPGAAYSYASNPLRKTVSAECQRNGNLASVKGSSTYIATTTTFEQRALLGGLLPLTVISSEGAANNTNSEMVAVESVYGVPFPFTSGKRFGIKYTSASSADGFDPVPVALHCVVTDVTIDAPTPTLASAPQLVCVSQAATFQIVSRWAFDAASGCAIGMRTQTY